MVLLDVMMRVAPDRVAAVATFDHGTGPHAFAAVELVSAVAGRHGVAVKVGRAAATPRTEAAWRAARWTFLSATARELGAAVATGHTADDQLETVCMRILRGSGARGLAGLHARSAIQRPLLAVFRRDVVAWAGAAGVRFLEDPSNSSPVYLRNRLRRDILPAIARVRPEFAREMLALAREAADVRAGLDRVAADLVTVTQPGCAVVSVEHLADLTPESVAALGPSLVARAGIVLDRRGTTRVTQFILKSRHGSRIQLSGGGEVARSGEQIVIRRVAPIRTTAGELSLGRSLDVGGWSFRTIADGALADAWTAALPADGVLTVRGWRAGDRMRAGGSPSARRVKRFFSDAGIPGPERVGWPVVLADGEIVWIPGVRRSDAATDRSGRPVLRYRCERNDV